MILMKKILSIFLSLVLITVLSSCAPSAEEQLKQGFEELTSGKAIHATALFTEGDNNYSNELLYVNGEDFLHITNGPDNAWQQISLYADKDQYSAFLQPSDPESSYALSYQTTTSLPEMPVFWMKMNWDDIKGSVVSTQEDKGILTVTCKDGELTTVYQLKDGKIICIAYTSTETFYDADSNPVDHVFINAYTFHQISQQEVEAVFAEYLAKAQA